jgi:anti-sigma regulatory factor (Ser/Thr protein kinase)
MVHRSASPAAHDHDVTFYDRDTEVVADVARFVAVGLAHGERVVVVATDEHRAGIDEVLEQHGEDPVGARRTGRYLTLDAAETLATFMVDGVPRRPEFERAIGRIIDRAAADGSPVRVFGEMVALLWAHGNVSGAIELEALWNGLATTRRFSLLCAYPTSILSGSPLQDIHSVCHLHAKVVSPRSYSAARRPQAGHVGAEQVSEVFVPVTAAAPAARRFVRSTLTAWGLQRLIEDATLATSEIASNAVKHAVSPFRLRISRDHAVLRVTVEDVAPVPPVPRTATDEDFGGRGLAIVERVANRWGCDALSNGKAVWAEFHVDPLAARAI